MSDGFKAKYPGTCGLCHRPFPAGTWVEKIEPVKMRRFSHYSNARHVRRGENVVYEYFSTNRAHEGCVRADGLERDRHKLEGEKAMLSYELGRTKRELDEANRQLEQMAKLEAELEKVKNDRVYLKRDVNAYRRTLRTAGLSDA